MTLAQDLLPNAQKSLSGGALTLTGGATSYAVTNDNTNASYLQQTTFSTLSTLLLDVGTYTPAALAHPARVRAKVKVTTTAASKMQLGVFTARTPSLVPYSSTLTNHSGQGTAQVLTWVYGAWETLSPDYGTNIWAYNANNALQLSGVTISLPAQTAVGDRPIVYEVRLEVEDNYNAVTSALAPASGTITDTSYPLFTWLHSDIEGDPAYAYHAYIYPRATAEAGGFYVGGYGYLVEDDVANVAGATWSPPTALPLTGDFYFALKAYQLESGQVITSSLVLAASYFTMAVTGPPAPEVTATVDNPNQRITVTAQGFMNALTEDQAQLTTAIANAYATAGTNCTASRSTVTADIGSASLLLTPTGAFGDASTSIPTNDVPAVTPNRSYTAHAKFKAGTTARTCRVGIQYLTAAKAATGSLTWGTGVADSTSAFTQVKVSATSPANAAYAQVHVQAQATASGTDIHYVDTIALHPSNAGLTALWSPGGSISETFTITNSGFATDGQGANETTAVLAADQAATWTEYTIPRGVARTWTVTENATLPTGVLTSAAAVTASQTITNDGSYWLKTKNVGGLSVKVKVVGTQATQREEQAGVFRPLDSPEAVKVGGQLYGEDGTYTILVETLAAWALFLPAYIYQLPVCVQDPYGEQKWVVWTSRSDVKELAPAAPRHTVTLGYTEVAIPESA